MGVTMYAASLGDHPEFIRVGKTAGWEGTLPALVAFIEKHQSIVVFREDLVPVKAWETDGFFDERKLPEAPDPLDIDTMLLAELTGEFQHSANRLLWRQRIRLGGGVHRG